MDNLRIHFVNVGHGDCTFIEFPSNRLAMIDINNTKTLPGDVEDGLAHELDLSLTEFKRAALSLGAPVGRSWEDYYKSLLDDPVDYYRDHFNGRNIFRYIQTHPDADHMNGLHRFFWQEKISLGCFWDVPNTKTVTEAESNASGRFAHEDWEAYQAMRQGQGPDGTTFKVLHNFRDETGNYWTDDHVQILSPTRSLADDVDAQGSWNDMSYVLKINYGGRSVILPGDAERTAWNNIMDAYPASELRCDVLKAAHHGRQSGYHEAAVTAMDPRYVIASVGKKPGTDAISDYKKHGADVLSTRRHGTIVVTVWEDGEVWIDKGADRLGALPVLAA